MKDLSAGCGQMFEVVIVTPLFEGKRLLARHKIVNESLKEEINKVHAFTQVSSLIFFFFTWSHVIHFISLENIYT